MHTVQHLDLISSHQTEREKGAISKRKIGVVLHRSRERIASSSSSVVCSAFTVARPLPHCQRHAVEKGLIGFFFRSDFISLCERLYFMTSLHFLFAFCSYCILLQLVAVEIKAGFFFWVLILFFYEKDCILKFYCIFVCVFVQIVCNNFTYERRVACICSL